MNESETSVHEHAEHGEDAARRICTTLVQSKPKYQTWVASHDQPMWRVARARTRDAQLVQLRLVAIHQIHRAALVRHLRDQNVGPDIRRRLFTEFHGVLDSDCAVLAEHRSYMQAVSSQLCASCHVDVASRLGLPSHHPVSEGMLDCTDCHAPHASEVSRLGPPTERCASCHQDMVGPWIYEHPPVAEDCGYCHTPHGAVSDSLLETPQPGTCISCHTLAQMGATHDPAAYVSRCSDCHSAVHGSYADPVLRR